MDGGVGVNILNAFYNHALRNPGRLALVVGDRTYTYGQGLDEVTRLAGGLAALGVQAGDRVAIMLPNSAEFVWGTYAAWWLGAVQVAINVMYKERETAHLLGDSGARVVITAPQFLPIVEAVKAKVPELQHTIVVGADGPGLTYREVAAKSAPVPRPAHAGEDDLAVIAYTSGTTGLPKGAMLTHGNFIFQFETYRTYLGLGPEDHALICLPLFLLSILIVGPACSHYLGSACIIQPRFQAAEFARLLKEYRPTWLGGTVPTMYHDLAQLPKEELDLSSVRYASIGGAPIPAPKRREFEAKFGFRLTYAYGATETSAHVTMDPLDRPPKEGSPGVALPGRDIKVVDEEGNPLPPNGVGEICVRGPNILKGYWNLPEATAAALRDGWFHTSDLGYLDEDGYIYIVDRKQDVINRGGFKIFPVEIEKVLYEDPRVLECAVVGSPDPRLGEVPKAFIVLKEGATATAEEFIQLTRRELANYKALAEVEFRTALPKSPLLKILRRELRREERERKVAP